MTLTASLGEHPHSCAYLLHSSRLGSDRYKTKTVYETLSPKWHEQFELYLYEESQELEITVWDRDQRSKDDFMGR